MDLKSSHPFWPILVGLPASYPPLADDEACDVVILGAGITGALVADVLTRKGLNVVVLDGREVGHGSTAATTGLLQYEIDVPLCDLIEKVGRANAERAYQLCRDSIIQLEHLAAELPSPCGFDRKVSLYAASSERDVAELQREQQARLSCGIEVEIVEGTEVQNRYGINAPALLVSRPAAVCNAFAMAHGVLQICLQRGARVFDRTTATKVNTSESGVTVETDRGPRVTARHVVFATGYESQNQLRRPVARLKSTYAVVTQPLTQVSPWNDDWIYWESARPYLYLRTTEDGRLLAGGEDDPFRNPRRRDARLAKKSRRLLQRMEQMFPNLPLEVEYSWAGTFGETEDGLAYIGADPDRPRAWFALGFGGNGITFSAVAAKILADLITGQPNADAEIFRFGR